MPCFFYYIRREKYEKNTASTQGLQKAMDQKQVAPTNTGVDPYKKAQSYLKAMLPAITRSVAEIERNGR